MWSYVWFMARNLGHHISCDLHSRCRVMALTADLSSDLRAHIFRTDRGVKYKYVYGQMNAAGWRYCQNEQWRTKSTKKAIERCLLRDIWGTFGRDIACWTQSTNFRFTCIVHRSFTSFLSSKWNGLVFLNLLENHVVYNTKYAGFACENTVLRARLCCLLLHGTDVDLRDMSTFPWSYFILYGF